MPAKKITFEQKVSELEQIVSMLENGDAPLDKCIEFFEKGVKLSNECVKILDSAQQKVTLLTDDGEKEFKTEQE